MKTLKKFLILTFALLTLFILPTSTNATEKEDIFSIRIENIDRYGADFYWSTSVETIGSVEYAYSKLAEKYNPQSAGTNTEVLLTATPLQVRSEDHYVKNHHIRIDKLDANYNSFVQYTIKSQTSDGDIFSLDGELVLFDTQQVKWWQSSWFAIGFPIFVFILGILTRNLHLKPRNFLQSIKTKLQIRKKPSNTSATTWKDKWKSIESKFETCTTECVTAYHSDIKCKDSIEAVIADIWNLRDWLINDPSVGIPKEIIYEFVEHGLAYNIRACGDIEIKNKHFRVDDPKRENTELVWDGNHSHPSGYPVIFKVIRKYKDNPGNTDQWEDAFELARRAIEEWKTFLRDNGLT